MSFEQEERCSRAPEPDLTARLNSDRELSSGLTPVLDERIIKLDQKYQSGERIILMAATSAENLTKPQDIKDTFVPGGFAQLSLSLCRLA